MQQFSEPEELIRNPLMDEPTIERSYTKPNVEASQEQLSQDIPEPSFNPPPLNADGNDTGDVGSDKAKKKEAPKAPPANPALNDASDKDKEEASEHVADLVIEGYANLKEQANHLLVISPKKLNKLQMEGKIDLSLPMPYGMGEVAPAAEVIAAYNEDVKGTFSLSKDFRKQAKPLLMKILAKRGVGLTDEQALGFLVGKDLVGMGFTSYHMLRNANEMLNGLQEMTTAYRSSGAVAQGQPAQAQPMTTAAAPGAGTPPPPPPPAPKEDAAAAADPIAGDKEQQHSQPMTNTQTIYNQMEEMQRQKDSTHVSGTWSAPPATGKGPRVPKRATSGKRGRKKAADYIEDAITEE